MSYEGIWSIQIGSDFGWQTLGILVLEKGRALGGSGRAYSHGTYQGTEKTLRMSLHVHYYRSPRSLFGVTDKDVDLRLEAERLQDTLKGQVERPDMPGVSLPVRLTWRAPLPKPSPHTL